MPPYVPEEVNVFSVPHSRMKELVNNYFDMVHSTNFTDMLALEQLLKTLLETFREFKTHEQIENQFIMKRLKVKLKKLSIRNTAVCNCHKDNALTDMMRLLKDGYRKKTDQDRLNYGLQLKKALEDFTNNFLPHMREEEEVFQPLLLQYFSYEELCELKQKVIQQHFERELEKTRWLKSSENDSGSSSSSESESEETRAHKGLLWSCDVAIRLKKRQAARAAKLACSCTTIDALPPEVLNKVFSYLGPQDLCHIAQVSKQWKKMAMDPILWRNVLPTQWAKGDWSFANNTRDDDEEEETFPEDIQYLSLDDDADIDESQDIDYSDTVQQMRNEVRILSGLSQYLLPTVGLNVKKLVLANSRTLTDGLLHRLLCQCPNVEHLDVAQTRISDVGLRRLAKNGCGNKLKNVNFSGCVNITDASMVRLAMALSDINCIRGSDVTYEVEDGDLECLCDEYYRIYHKDLRDGCNDINEQLWVSEKDTVCEKEKETGSVCETEIRSCCEKELGSCCEKEREVRFQEGAICDCSCGGDVTRQMTCNDCHREQQAGGNIPRQDRKGGNEQRIDSGGQYPQDNSLLDDSSGACDNCNCSTDDPAQRLKKSKKWPADNHKKQLEKQDFEENYDKNPKKKKVPTATLR